jgi:hypothetical protein
MAEYSLSPGAKPKMRTVSIWASGLLASAIPFVFVGGVIAFLACVFDAVGQHAPPARSGPSSQAEAASPERCSPLRMHHTTQLSAKQVSTLTATLAITTPSPVPTPA